MPPTASAYCEPPPNMPQRNYFNPIVIRPENCLARRYAPAAPQPPVNHLYQGMMLDAVMGLYDERFRHYSPTRGRLTSRDP